MPPIPKPTDKQIEEWRKQMKKDHPLVEDYFIDLLLEVYKSDPGYVEAAVKKAKKEQAKFQVKSTVPPTPQTFEAKTVEIIPPELAKMPEQEGAQLLSITEVGEEPADPPGAVVSFET